jgi:hypothetical protein
LVKALLALLYNCFKLFNYICSLDSVGTVLTYTAVGGRGRM